MIVQPYQSPQALCRALRHSVYSRAATLQKAAEFVFYEYNLQKAASTKNTCFLQRLCTCRKTWKFLVFLDWKPVGNLGDPGSTRSWVQVLNITPRCVGASGSQWFLQVDGYNNWDSSCVGFIISYGRKWKVHQVFWSRFFGQIRVSKKIGATKIWWNPMKAMLYIRFTYNIYIYIYIYIIHIETPEPIFQERFCERNVRIRDVFFQPG